MNVLAIDTSNYSLGIALVNQEQVIGEYITNMKKNHSIRVMPAIEKLMQDCEMKPTDVEKNCCCKGSRILYRRTYWCNDCQNTRLDFKYPFGWNIKFRGLSCWGRSLF